ncbi:hypothetical protein H5P28_09025 [Ruficoccus amylovorans]|uniref:Uncharacterized protein n=1 Tax=Ruficoccus amylovorans TaxID=1804625 RepID=A0A842HFP7_9BACT|nr:hypothetical protein [Ruficoccus amylovorans]MBC2594397.1 hypothetical protein [Ruficoccus amylovorans]
MLIQAIIGASGLAALWSWLKEDKNEDGFTGNEAVLFNEESKLPSADSKAVKQLATEADVQIDKLREHLAGIIPDDFEFSLALGRDEEFQVTWRVSEIGMVPRVPKISDDTLLGLLRKVQLVDWDNERELARKGAKAFESFCEKCREFNGAYEGADK